MYKKLSVSDDVLITEVNIKMDKTKDLSDFDRGRIVGERRTGASISEATTLLGFSGPEVSRLF